MRHLPRIPPSLPVLFNPSFDHHSTIIRPQFSLPSPAFLSYYIVCTTYLSAA